MSKSSYDLSHTPTPVIVGAWGLTILVSAIAFIAWGATYRWHLGSLTSYQIFPLLGLLAFSIMWSHYAAAAARDTFGVAKTSLANYFRFTGYAVLVLICLHPGILIYQRFRDGYGLPPKSYETYVAPGLGWITLLGAVSLLVFLAFELHRWYGERSWWHYVAEAGDVAMLAIFYHALRLGSQIHGWYRGVWLFYGLSLVVLLIRKYLKRYVLPSTTS